MTANNTGSAGVVLQGLVLDYNLKARAVRILVGLCKLCLLHTVILEGQISLFRVYCTLLGRDYMVRIPCST